MYGFKGSDYKKAFEKAVKELIAHEMPVTWKNKAVHELTELYISQTGEYPSSDQLDILADYILYDDLADKHPDKISRTEYPFLSEGQSKLRKKRELALEQKKMDNFTLNPKYQKYGKSSKVQRNKQLRDE